MAVPISITNPDLLRHSTELFMDSGFSPLCQRMGAMVAFRRFEDFTRYPEWLSLSDTLSRGAKQAFPGPHLFICVDCLTVHFHTETLRKLFYLSVPLFSHLYDGDKRRIYFIGSLGKLNEIVYIKYCI